MNKYFWSIIIALLVVGGIFFLNQKKSSVNRALITSTTVTDSFPIKEFSMTAKQWSFDPPIITVKQGDRVRIKIKSTDVIHGFALNDFNIKVVLIPNKEETVDFIADKKGEFTFFCSVICGESHKDMTGKLIVK